MVIVDDAVNKALYDENGNRAYTSSERARNYENARRRDEERENSYNENYNDNTGSSYDRD